jgi:hypothetical protein
VYSDIAHIEKIFMDEKNNKLWKKPKHKYY